MTPLARHYKMAVREDERLQKATIPMVCVSDRFSGPRLHQLIALLPT